MGVCGCGSENEFYKINKDVELVMEKYNDCPDCGGQSIQINILNKKDRICFGDYEEIKKKKLAYWCGKEKNRDYIIIKLQDFKDTLKRKTKETFEDMWYDIISEKELENIPEKLIEKIESEFLKLLLIKIKED